MRGDGALEPCDKRLPAAGYPPRYGEFGHLPTWIPFSLPGGLSPGVFLGVVLGVARGVAWGCSAAHSGFLPVIPDTSGAPGGGSPSLSLSFRCILLRYMTGPSFMGGTTKDSPRSCIQEHARMVATPEVASEETGRSGSRPGHEREGEGPCRCGERGRAAILGREADRFDQPVGEHDEAKPGGPKRHHRAGECKTYQLVA